MEEMHKQYNAEQDFKKKYEIFKHNKWLWLVERYKCIDDYTKSMMLLKFPELCISEIFNITDNLSCKTRMIAKNPELAKLLRFNENDSAQDIIIKLHHNNELATQENFDNLRNICEQGKEKMINLNNLLATQENFDKSQNDNVCSYIITRNKALATQENLDKNKGSRTNRYIIQYNKDLIKEEFFYDKTYYCMRNEILHHFTKLANVENFKKETDWVIRDMMVKINPVELAVKELFDYEKNVFVKYAMIDGNKELIS